MRVLVSESVLVALWGRPGVQLGRGGRPVGARQGVALPLVGRRLGLVHAAAGPLLIARHHPFRLDGPLGRAARCRDGGA